MEVDRKNKKLNRDIRDRLLVGVLLMLMAYGACLSFVFIIEDLMATQIILTQQGETIAITLGIIYIIAISILVVLGIYAFISSLYKAYKINFKSKRRQM